MITRVIMLLCGIDIVAGWCITAYGAYHTNATVTSTGIAMSVLGVVLLIVLYIIDLRRQT